jgi:hypothetical protein
MTPTIQSFRIVEKIRLPRGIAVIEVEDSFMRPVPATMMLVRQPVEVWISRFSIYLRGYPDLGGQKAFFRVGSNDF